MKKLFFIILSVISAFILILLLIPEKKAIDVESKNYIIFLDISDRITGGESNRYLENKDQVIPNDLEHIKLILREFKKEIGYNAKTQKLSQSKNALVKFLGNESSFQVFIKPDITNKMNEVYNTGINIKDWCLDLNDIKKVNYQNKLESISSFNPMQSLNYLYNNKSEFDKEMRINGDYSNKGSDIFGFLLHDMPLYLDETKENYVIIISDGYLHCKESDIEVVAKENEVITLEGVGGQKFRNDPELCNIPDEILPKFNKKITNIEDVNFCLLGLQGYRLLKGEYLDPSKERYMLKKIWETWFQKNDIKTYSIIEYDGTSHKELINFLNN